jgi:hypothetical protein
MDAQKLSTTFVELADSLVDDFDVFDVLHVLVEGCVDVLGVSAAGLLLADEQNRLHVAASSAERARLLDLYQLQNDEGPCLDCFRSGVPVSAPTLKEARDRWPRFVPAAIDQGFGGALALPLRLRGRVVGALNLFGDQHSRLDEPVIHPIAQAMADVSTVAILQGQAGKEREMLNEQLQTALDSRIVIEQGKGVLATRLGVEIDEAFELMRRHARNARRPLAEVAEEVVHARSEEFWQAFRRR